MFTTTNNNPTDGRVYGGDTGLIHIEDGERREVGAWLASMLDQRMRADAYESERRTDKQAQTQDLCPGCYMVAIFNCAIELAKDNGQDLKELGKTMAKAFKRLARNPAESNIEHIEVILDTHQVQAFYAMSQEEWENYATTLAYTSGGWAWTA